MAITVRDARPADLPAMRRAKRDAGAAAWPHIFPVEILAALPFVDRWEQAVRTPARRTHALVAVEGGRVRGFAIVRPSADDDADESTGELDGFYVAPAWWGRGAGRALMDAATETLRQDEFVTATLWTAVDNHRPRRIYERAGWRPDGAVRHRNLGGVAFDELRYRMRL
jgi:GNAT superfamily N-acetyltransferase